VETQVTDRATSEDKSISTHTLTALAKVPASPQGIPARGITPLTVQKFGVVVAGESHIYPYYSKDDPNQLIAAKKRLPNKAFPSEGKMNDTALFGQHVFPANCNRNIVITEGECDAMAVFQLQGSKYPSVSVRSATSALSDCKRNYLYLDSFESIIVYMDNDAAGKKASLEIADLFAGKSKVINSPAEYKDACDVLSAGANGRAAWKTMFWQAETYTPDGIIAGSSMWAEVSKPIVKSEAEYPWAGLNALTYGIRKQELVTVAAGSGLGKSQFIREIISGLLDQTSWKMGLMFLEESSRATGRSIMSLAANKPLHLPTTVATDEEIKEAFDATLGQDRMFFLDHFGSTSIENIVARARYMVKALDCEVIFLDHISIVVSSGENGDERKALDEAMTRLRTLAQELDVAIFVVSHLKRPDGKGHEDGATTSLSQLRGSASIAQLSDFVIGLERNGQAEDPIEANTTRIRVLKNRFSGETGRCGALLFDKATGRMNEVADEDVL
jgi:twinkle protein